MMLFTVLVYPKFKVLPIFVKLLPKIIKVLPKNNYCVTKSLAILKLLPNEDVVGTSTVVVENLL